MAHFGIFYRDWRQFSAHSPYWCFDFDADHEVVASLRSLACEIASAGDKELDAELDPIDAVGGLAGWFKPVAPQRRPTKEEAAAWEAEREEHAKKAREEEEELMRLPIPPIARDGTRWRVTVSDPLPRPSNSVYFWVTSDERVALLALSRVHLRSHRRVGYRIVEDPLSVRAPAASVLWDEELVRARDTLDAIESSSSEEKQTALTKLIERSRGEPLNDRVDGMIRAYRTALPAGWRPRTVFHVLQERWGALMKMKGSHLDCLQALRELGAVSPDTRRAAIDVARAVVGSSAGEDLVKKPMRELVELGLVGSKRGRGGGGWLNDVGRELIDIQRPEDPLP